MPADWMSLHRAPAGEAAAAEVEEEEDLTASRVLRVSRFHPLVLVVVKNPYVHVWCSIFCEAGVCLLYQSGLCRTTTLAVGGERLVGHHNLWHECNVHEVFFCVLPPTRSYFFMAVVVVCVLHIIQVLFEDKFLGIRRKSGCPPCHQVMPRDSQAAKMLRRRHKQILPLVFSSRRSIVGL